MQKEFTLNKVPEIQTRFKSLVCSIFLLLADMIAWLSVYELTASYEQIVLKELAIMPVIWCGWAAFIRKQYTRRYSFWVELGFVLQGLLTLALAGSILKIISGDVDILWMWWMTCLILAGMIPILRMLTRIFLRKINFWAWPTVVFGGGENARQAVLALRSEANMGYSVSAVSLPLVAPLHSEMQEIDVPFISWPTKSVDFHLLESYRCVIALEAHEHELRDKLIRQLSSYQIKYVHVIPAMRGVPLFGLATTSFFSHEVLMIHVKNRLSHANLRFLKRVFDVVGASILLLVLLPLFAYLAYKVSRDGGKAFYAHSRVGQGGKSFDCYKFRSMIANSEKVLAELLENNAEAKAEWERDFKLKNDPRINSLGHFLRRTSLDELPQLWNVLRGDMSLVGPRPVVRDELKRYEEDALYYLMVKPGMTGLWQVSGRNDVDYETRVYFDSWYVKNWSLWTDVVILFKTINVVLRRDGAY